MLNAWTRLTERLPGTCQVCARWPARPVCAACVARFAPPQPRCSVCAARLSGSATRCGACLGATRDGTDRSALDNCVAAVDYAFPWDGLIARFKFQSESGWAQPLADLMLEAPGAQPLLAQVQLIAPVPLSGERLGSRGYNQAWELVKALRRQASARGLPAPPPLAEALVRLRHTADQHSLPRAQRLKNLQGAFVAHPAHADRLAGAHVLLVDDVHTTGATLHSAAQALLQAGAQRVSALVFARTPPH
jgi:ComF family protein